MIRVLAAAVALLAGCSAPGLVPPAGLAATAERVVLVHGYGRSSRAMRPLEERLVRDGFAVCNVDYPSTEAPPATLVAHLRRVVRETCGAGAGRTDFVTHSLGGVLVRAVLDAEPSFPVGRVVMLAPPNHGSELVDVLRDLPLLELVLGPTARALGTSPGSLPRSLGRPAFELGVIAGTRGANPIVNALVGGENDGLVSVESTRIDGMSDFLTVPQSHVSIRRDPEVADQVIHFLRHGAFAHDAGAVGGTVSDVSAPPAGGS